MMLPGVPGRSESDEIFLCFRLQSYTFSMIYFGESYTFSRINFFSNSGVMDICGDKSVYN